MTTILCPFISPKIIEVMESALASEFMDVVRNVLLCISVSFLVHIVAVTSKYKETSGCINSQRISSIRKKSLLSDVRVVS